MTRGSEEPDAIDLFESYPVEDPPQDVIDQHLPLLSTMLEWGVNVDLLAILLELGGRKLDLEDKRFLIGPVVVHDSGWKDTTPPWLFKQARLERFDIVVGGNKQNWIVGPAEMAAVMYGAMLDAPRGAELSELYLWASVNASAVHYKRDLAGLWQQIGGQPVADDDVLERRGRLWHAYQELAGQVRRKVIAAQVELERDIGKRKAQEAKWRDEQAERQQAWEAERERRIKEGGPTPAYNWQPPAPKPPPEPEQQDMF